MDNEHDRSGQPDLDEPRPGQNLRVAREKAGISRESMVERMRIAAEQFDALERDDYAELPPPTFVRGYLRAYARELGLDPDEYIAAYNRSGSAARDPEIRGDGGTDTASGGRGGLIGLMLIALVAAGGIGAWWYQQRMGDGNDDSGAVDSVEQERTAGDDAGTGTDTLAAASGDVDTDEAPAAAQNASEGTASETGGANG
ncbi:MAG: helix-turn-helix domain-containing protein, partial [Halofilum sp. (in: g-proteobacteria)]